MALSVPKTLKCKLLKHFRERVFSLPNPQMNLNGDIVLTPAVNETIMATGFGDVLGELRALKTEAALLRRSCVFKILMSSFNNTGNVNMTRSTIDTSK